MNSPFFQEIEAILHGERIDAYRRDGADEALTLARYLFNMALSGSLYPSLQFAEIALRNAIHTALTIRCSTNAWYDTIAGLLPWQEDKIQEARLSLRKNGKAITPGRMVAELNFGFWTGFFNSFHSRTGLGHYLTGAVFVHAPDAQRSLTNLDARWRGVRDIRNRVFHHERILHWRDLDVRHQTIFDLISWISPELHELARTLDHFSAIRQQGLTPWIDKIRNHWPQP